MVIGAQMTVNCWITMQDPDDKAARKVWVKDDPHNHIRSNMLRERAEKMKKGDLCVFVNRPLVPVWKRPVVRANRPPPFYERRWTKILVFNSVYSLFQLPPSYQSSSLVFWYAGNHLSCRSYKRCAAAGHQMASAMVGSPMLGCQSLMGHWLAMMVAPAW